MGAKKESSKGTRKKVKKSRAKARSQEEGLELEKKFDFGGMPDRDLKKNLGC